MDINYIIVSNITEETPVATLPGFGVHAILCQFPTSKTVATFGRHRYYSSISEMDADGWADTDAVLMAARSAFSQNPRTERVMVGRIDSGDASITASAPAPMAKLTSAAANAGASLMPSPAMATVASPRRNAEIASALPAGEIPARNSSIPA